MALESKKKKLGEFQTLVLQTVPALQKDAYGVQIKHAVGARLKETVSMGSIQSALKHLEAKGFLTSKFGTATQRRGGKRKRIYTITPQGAKAIGE